MPNLAIGATAPAITIAKPEKFLTFKMTPLYVHRIGHDGQMWFSSGDIAKALAYQTENSVTKIFNRNQDEFTEGMSEVLNLGTSGNLQKTVRLFSLRGAYLVAMFARTPVAKAFRRWVLDILDREAENRRRGIGPDGYGVCSSAPDAVRKFLSRKEFVINFIDGTDQVDIKLLERKSPYDGLAKAIADPTNYGLKDEVIEEIAHACTKALAYRATTWKERAFDAGKKIQEGKVKIKELIDQIKEGGTK